MILSQVCKNIKDFSPVASKTVYILAGAGRRRERRQWEMTKIWAHRGASAYAPENTLEAFELAVKMGADGVELDVHLTRDGRLAVCHDENIQRVTREKGQIRGMTLEELKGYDFGALFPRYAGAKMPTLEEVYELLCPTGLTVNVELKTNVYEYQGIEEKCVKAARDFHMEDRVIYSSFNFMSLDRMRQVDKTVPTALLYDRAIPNVERIAQKLGACALHPHYKLLYADGAVERARNAHLELHPWTVDEAEDIKRLTGMGVEAIITDVPDKGRA